MAEVNSLSDVKTKPMVSPLRALFDTAQNLTGQESPVRPLVNAITRDSSVPAPVDSGEFDQGAPPPAPVPVEEAIPAPEQPIQQQAPTMATTTQTNTTMGGSTTVQPGVYYSPEVIAKQAAADKAQQEAIRAGADIGTAKAVEETAQMAERDRLLKAHQEATFQEEARRKKEMDADRKNIESALSDVASSKIDPNHLMQKDTANAILAAIGSAMGAYASTISGAPNFAQQIIDKAIDRDIDAQKAAMSNKQQKVENLRGTYRDNLARFGDERQAELVTRSQIMEAAKLKIETLGAKYGGPEANAKALGLSASLQQNQAQLSREMAERSQAKISKTENVTTSVESITKPLVPPTSSKEKFENTSVAKNEFRKVAEKELVREESIKDLDNLMKDSKNPVSKAQIGTAIIKLQQTGVISDQDKKDFQTVGGVLGNTAAYISGKVSGGFTKAEMANINQFLEKAKKSNKEDIGKAVSEHMSMHKNNFGTMIGAPEEIYTPSQIAAGYAYQNKSKKQASSAKVYSGMAERK